MNKLALLGVTLGGLLTGFLMNQNTSSLVSERLSSDTRVHVTTSFGKSLNIDINAGLELKDTGQFEYYIVIPRDIGFSAVGDYQLDDGLLSLNITNSEPLLGESSSKDPLQLYEKLVSRAEMHTTENMMAFRPQHNKDALLLFSERGAFYFKPR
ncbi:hypothetical protein HWV00_04165 [Moritella sp. 24]|uniref:hypothetical protein n=1 Tax=Moritella sp. 24 TaxID=2746230 RepID=UPI001BAC32BE|nr:hypothetical protein [Moritella sp. 24]QUM75492.1 hypothetical protein HWV00_04165 [Moritella sp. 24]